MICTWTAQCHLGLQSCDYLIIISNYPSFKLMGVVYYKWRPVVTVAVVAESIRCLGQETEQYEVCSPVK